MKPIQLLPLLLALLLSLLSAVHSDLASERAALVTLCNSVEGRSLLWNLSSSPCSWVGVFCDSTRTTVVELRLPGIPSLGGFLKQPTSDRRRLEVEVVRSRVIVGCVDVEDDEKEELLKTMNMFWA